MTHLYSDAPPVPRDADGGPLMGEIGRNILIRPGNPDADGTKALAAGRGGSREWYALQGRYFDLAHEYHDATAARRAAILTEMHATIRAWRRIGIYAEWDESAML